MTPSDHFSVLVKGVLQRLKSTDQRQRQIPKIQLGWKSLMMHQLNGTSLNRSHLHWKKSWSVKIETSSHNSFHAIFVEQLKTNLNENASFFPKSLYIRHLQPSCYYKQFYLYILFELSPKRSILQLIMNVYRRDGNWRSQNPSLHLCRRVFGTSDSRLFLLFLPSPSAAFSTINSVILKVSPAQRGPKISRTLRNPMRCHNCCCCCNNVPVCFCRWEGTTTLLETFATVGAVFFSKNFFPSGHHWRSEEALRRGDPPGRAGVGPSVRSGGADAGCSSGRNKDSNCDASVAGPKRNGCFTSELHNFCMFWLLLLCQKQ